MHWLLKIYESWIHLLRGYFFGPANHRTVLKSKNWTHLSGSTGRYSLEYLHWEKYYLFHTAYQCLVSDLNYWIVFIFIIFLIYQIQVDNFHCLQKHLLYCNLLSAMHFLLNDWSLGTGYLYTIFLRLRIFLTRPLYKLWSMIRWSFFKI